MDTDQISQIGVSVAFILSSIDLAFQIRKISKAKTSKEISIKGLVIRFVAVALFWFRFLVINDIVFLVGQSIFLGLLVAYTVLAIKYRKNG